MQLSLAVLLTSACLSGNVWPAESFLYQPAFCMDHELRHPARPYHPQPGDIFVASDHTPFGKISHRIAFTACPQHSGVVVARSDGRIALLEAGPFNTLHCAVSDLVPHLTKYAENERVWIRARKVPLTCDQSRRLTAFAEAVDGKRFAVLRLIAQASPFRTRGPIRTEFVGKARSANFEPCCGERGLKHSYFCSELVTEALVAARALDSETARPSATYPRDLFFGRSVNRWNDEHLNLCDWEAPARWTLYPGKEGCPKYRPWLDKDGAGPAGGCQKCPQQ